MTECHQATNSPTHLAPPPSAAKHAIGRWGHPKEMSMADDKSNSGAQDRSRIALGEDHEVAYWTKKFRVSKDTLADAVGAVGNSAQAVADFLNKRL
jgi:hypothetical protein